ncbi:hypothetical protein Hanom_Chr10g00926851 [Helianthus anomalus]
MESRYSSSFCINQIKKLNILDPDHTLFPLSTNHSSNRSFNCSHLLILLQSIGLYTLDPSSFLCGFLSIMYMISSSKLNMIVDSIRFFILIVMEYF